MLDTQAVLVAMDTVAGVVPVDGTVEARHETTLATRMMATVTSVSVDVGDRVRAGEVVMILGAEDVDADRESAEAAVVAATAGRQEARKQVARMDTLFAQDVVPLARRDEARLALTVASSRLAAAEAALRQAVNAGRYATLSSPFTGTVVKRHIDPGDLALPGVPLLELTADGPREAVLGVPSDMIRQIEPGSVVVVDGGAFGTSNAIVRAIASGADPRSRTVEVRAALPSNWPTGISVTALIPNQARTIVTIPLSAVIRRGQLTGVRVVTNQGMALRWIRLGRQFAKMGADSVEEPWIEVLSGLEPGERIVP
jgi:RND family efflux transporter MFP subunit